MAENIATIAWNATQRDEIKNVLQSKEFDLLVIGGGITGAGVAREAQIYGLKCALVDKNDFAFGTSSRSTKMAHGGIRYLKNLELGLVKESVTERNWMRVHFPNLVRPVPFAFCAPFSIGSTFMLKLGVYLYDHLSDSGQKFKNYKKHQLFMNKADWNEIEPGLIKDGLIGGGIYYDNNVDDARLTLEVIKEAVARGATALNYAKVVDYSTNDQGKIVAAKAEDAVAGDVFEIRAKVFINATGIWT
ncbi:MAG TPA: FAD-dependent oxidoreductase, partial [Candidatus Lokiarchaeia archaeon]|nr:FAD-dependent oxidoreductase [Candidatus Lokiarchaeia archaeon]